MNKQIIQSILYMNIMATQSKNPLMYKEMLNPVFLATNLPPEKLPEPLPPLVRPLNQDELLEVLVNTISDVLKLYTNTTMPVGPVVTATAPGAIAPGATLVNLLP